MIQTGILQYILNGTIFKEERQLFGNIEYRRETRAYFWLIERDPYRIWLNKTIFKLFLFLILGWRVVHFWLCILFIFVIWSWHHSVLSWWHGSACILLIVEQQLVHRKISLSVRKWSYKWRVNCWNINRCSRFIAQSQRRSSVVGFIWTIQRSSSRISRIIQTIILTTVSCASILEPNANLNE